MDALVDFLQNVLGRTYDTGKSNFYGWVWVLILVVLPLWGMFQGLRQVKHRDKVRREGVEPLAQGRVLVASAAATADDGTVYTTEARVVQQPDGSYGLTLTRQAGADQAPSTSQHTLADWDALAACLATHTVLRATDLKPARP